MKGTVLRLILVLLLLGVVMLLVPWLSHAYVTRYARSSPDPSEETLQTITLIQEPWKSSVAHNAVARILLEEELGYTVNIVTMPDDRDQARALITGEASVNLEMWPSGIDETFRRYLEADIIVKMGPLGASSQSGWYIPTYLRDTHPTLTSWEDLKDPEIVELFALGDEDRTGVLLSGDSTWDAYLEMLISNLELPYEVVYTGSEETLLQTVDQAYHNQEPVLFFFWEPHPAHLTYDLTRIRLPAYTAECYDLLEGGGMYCDYPRDVLLKVAYPGLEQQAPKAFTFVQKFFYPSNEVLLSLMQAIEESATPEEGARRWLRENEDVWRTWMPDNAQALPARTAS